MNTEKLSSENETSNGILGAVRRSLFGHKFLYLDLKTRVRYGFKLKHLGTTYTLERKLLFWNEVAWTYPSTHPSQNLQEIIDYLKWYELDSNTPKYRCLF